MPFDAVEIVSTVFEVEDCAVIAGLNKVIDSKVGKGHGFHVGGGFCSNAVSVEWKITRCQYAALAVVDVDILHVGKVSHASRHDDINLIFHGASLGAVANAAIALPLVGEKGDKKDLDSLVYKMSRELWKFGVVANQYADRAAIRRNRR